MSSQSNLQSVHTAIVRAVDAVNGDSGASPVLRAVVEEFLQKSVKANNAAFGVAATRDAVIELEQAGDSARVAAEADTGLAGSARDAVLDAHLRICTLKAGL